MVHIIVSLGIFFLLMLTTGLILCILFAIGAGLVEEGDDTGWIFIAGGLLFILLVVYLHLRAIRQSQG